MATYSQDVRLEDLKESPLIDGLLLDSVGFWVRAPCCDEDSSKTFCLVPLSLIISPRSSIKQYLENPTAAKFRFSCTAKQVDMALLIEDGRVSLVDLTHVPGSPFFPGLSKSRTLM